MPVLISPDWTPPSRVFAYTSTRSEGFSAGVYAGLNVGAHVGDDPQCVVANRKRLPFSENIVWLNQVHGNMVIDLSSGAYPIADTPTADASVTRSSRFACAVMTADCVPVLLTNSAGTEVAAVHAGWQGLEKAIIAETLNRMQSRADDMQAWIGPAISQRCYEVPATLAERFSAFGQAIMPSDGEGKMLLDLPAIAVAQLHACGVNNVTTSALCTYSDAERFYSHRRATHEGMAATGRIVSVIGIQP